MAGRVRHGALRRWQRRRVRDRRGPHVARWRHQPTHLAVRRWRERALLRDRIVSRWPPGRSRGLLREGAARSRDDRHQSRRARALAVPRLHVDALLGLHARGLGPMLDLQLGYSFW